MTQIATVGVVGCGLMGRGITQLCAQHGYRVVVREVDQAALEAGIEEIERRLAREAQRGRMPSEEADAARSRIAPTTDYGALAECELVIEAITEDLALKLDMWRHVDEVAGPDAFFATNTSSLPVMDQAAATTRPERFVGMHFFNPAQVMNLVEVSRSVSTSDETVAMAVQFAESLEKRVVQLKDKVGFVVDRLIVPYIIDGVRVLESGVGSVSDIDLAMRLGCGHPMGPLELGDLIGLDTIDSICEVMFDELRETRFAAPPTLRRMVAAGWYGRKSGMGFYDYSGDEPAENPDVLG